MNSTIPISIHITRNALISFTYRNYRGETSSRSVEVGSVYWMGTEWHPEPQRILHAFDLDKKEWRDFAMRDMSDVTRGKSFAGRAP
jgi:predicted DNA-binding transcriptional regulator YafY